MSSSKKVCSGIKVMTKASWVHGISGTLCPMLSLKAAPSIVAAQRPLVVCGRHAILSSSHHTICGEKHTLVDECLQSRSRSASLSSFHKSAPLYR